MILNVLSFLLGVVASLASKMGDLIITENVSLLGFLVIWQLVVILLWFINKLGKGSGGRGVKTVDQNHDGN